MASASAQTAGCSATRPSDHRAIGLDAEQCGRAARDGHRRPACSSARSIQSTASAWRSRISQYRPIAPRHRERRFGAASGRPPSRGRRGGCRSRRRARAGARCGPAPQSACSVRMALGQREVVAVVALADGFACRRRPRSARRRRRGSFRASPAGCGACACLAAHEQALGDQAVERVEAGAGDRFGRLRPSRRRRRRRTRAKHRCSASLSSSWLQSMVARSVCWRAGASRGARPSAPSASSRRSAISPGDEQPAARRRQLDRQRQPVDAPADLRDRGRVGVVQVEAGVVGARSLAEQRDGSPRRPARPRPRASRARAARAATPGSAPRPAALSGSRLVARTVSAGQAVQQPADERRGRQHVLEVVDHQQQVLGGQEALGGLVGGLAREHDDRERLDDRRGHVLGPLQRGERDEVRAVGEVRLDRARGLQRQARLADPARAREGEQPHAADAQPVRDRAHVVRRGRSSGSATAAARSRRPAGRHRGQRREVRRQIADDELEQMLGAIEVLQPVLTEIPERDIGRQLVGDQLARGARDQHLPAVAGRADPRRAVDVQTDVVVQSRRRPRRCGRPCARARPTPSGQRLATASARCAATAAATASRRPREGDEEGVTLGVDLATVVRVERRAQHALMLGEHLGVAAAQPRQQPRRALDVGEQERDGPARKLRHTRSYAQSPRHVKSCPDRDPPTAGPGPRPPPRPRRHTGSLLQCNEGERSSTPRPGRGFLQPGTVTGSAASR